MMTSSSANALLAVALLAGACRSDGPRPGIVREVTTSAPVNASGVPLAPSVSASAAGSGARSISVFIRTEGICNSLRVHWGDDGGWETLPPSNVPDRIVTASHNYPSTLALRGYKSVTAAGDGSTCIGQAQKRILVTPEVMTIGWVLANSACEDAPAIIQTKLGNVVYIVDVPPPVPGVGSPLVGQIVVGPNQVHDADGLADPADASFPFPGLRKYSVVVTVVPPPPAGPPQNFQGSKHFSFRVADANSLIRFCYNGDRMPPDPRQQQGFQVNFRADASNAALPP